MLTSEETGVSTVVTARYKSCVSRKLDDVVATTLKKLTTVSYPRYLATPPL